MSDKESGETMLKQHKTHAKSKLCVLFQLKCVSDDFWKSVGGWVSVVCEHTFMKHLLVVI